jgi:hypothetical protein
MGIGLKRIMLSVFSRQQVLKGAEYSKQTKKSARTDIQDPFFTILGVSQPEIFFDAIKSRSILDGFLGRFLSFVPVNKKPILNDLIEPIELNISDEMSRFLSDPFVLDATETKLSIKSPVGQAWNELRHEYHNKTNESNDVVYNALWGRAAEHIDKILMLLATDSGPHMRDLDWAKQMVEISINTMYDMLGSMSSQNVIEEEHKKVLRMIQSSNGLSKSEITRKTQWLDVKKRIEILTTLTESGQIRLIQVEMDGAGRPKTIYKATGK